MRDGYDSMVNGSGFERVLGASSLVGLVAKAGLVVITLGGAATAAAGTPLTRHNILNVLNQARQAQGLPSWGMANIEIMLRGIGVTP